MTLYHLPLSLLMIFGLKSIFLDVPVLTLACFLHSFALNNFQSFYLRWYLSFMLKCISWMQMKYGSWFCIHSLSLSFLIVALRPLVLRDTNKQCLLISGFCRVFYQDLLIPLRMQHSENKPQQEIFYRAKMKQEIGLKEGRRVKIWSLPTCCTGLLVSLAVLDCGFPRNVFWSWGHW